MTHEFIESLSPKELNILATQFMDMEPSTLGYTWQWPDYCGSWECAGPVFDRLAREYDGALCDGECAIKPYRLFDKFKGPDLKFKGPDLTLGIARAAAFVVVQEMPAGYRIRFDPVDPHCGWYNDTGWMSHDCVYVSTEAATLAAWRHLLDTTLASGVVGVAG